MDGSASQGAVKQRHVAADDGPPPPKPAKVIEEVSGDSGGYYRKFQTKKSLILGIATLSLIAIGGGVGASLANGSGGANLATAPSSTPTTSPTSSPTHEVLVASVEFCPIGWDKQKTATTRTACHSKGCDGQIHFCGLEDNKAYRLKVSMTGDYESSNEYASLTIKGSPQPKIFPRRSTDEDCGPMIEVLSTTVLAKSGNLTITYRNSNKVDPVCQDLQRGDWASKLQVLLEEAEEAV